MKKRVSVTIDQSVFKEAKSLGINVSQASENYLKLLISVIKSKTGSTGFGPATPGLKDWHGTTKDWGDYWSFLVKQGFRSGHDRNLYNYTQRFAEDFLRGDLSRVRDASEGVKRNAMSALSNFASFLGKKKYLAELLENYGIDWGRGGTSRLVIGRLLSFEEADNIWDWVRKVKEQKPELANLMDLVCVGGLRLVEGVNSNDLIVELAANGKLELNREGKNYQGGYYNSREQVLEHFWFANLFLRGNKNVYVSYVPREVVQDISKGSVISDARVIVKAVRRCTRVSRFGEIREAQNTYMTKYLKAEEVDFFAGRMGRSVFMQNYFNPARIGDLPERVFKGVTEIREKIKT